MALRRRIFNEEIAEMQREKAALVRKKLEKLETMDLSAINEKLDLIKDCESIIEEYFALMVEGKPYTALKQLCDLPTDRFHNKFGSYKGLTRVLQWSHFFLASYITKTMYLDLGRRVPPVDPFLYKSGFYAD